MQVALESAVRLGSFPKAVVDVYCLVLEAGGSELAVAITASSLALADAGVEMTGLVSACCIVRACVRVCARACVRACVRARAGGRALPARTGWQATECPQTRCMWVPDHPPPSPHPTPTPCQSKVEEQLLLDPTRAEQEREENGTLLGMMAGSDEVVQLVSCGQLTNAQVGDWITGGGGALAARACHPALWLLVGQHCCARLAAW